MREEQSVITNTAVWGDFVNIVIMQEEEEDMRCSVYGRCMLMAREKKYMINSQILQ